MTTDASGLDLLEKNAEQEAIAQARAEERRQSAIALVNSIYRLIKVLGIHAESNQAVLALVNNTVAAVSDYCQRTGAASASVLFADDTVFVNGQMLRASRDAYTTAVALGALFTKCGISEVTFHAALDASQAMEFARALHAALRDRSLAATTVERVIPGVKMRRIDGRTSDGEKVEEKPAAERVAQTFAASVVIMRQFYAEVSGGTYQLPHRIKRIAQKLVKDAEEAPHVLLALAASRASSDESSLAVSSAAISVLVARQLTNDRATLGNLATTALLFDVGRPRLAKSHTASEHGISRVLNDDELDRLPASAAAVLTVLGRMHTASITRTVVAFEALWARRARRLGQLYGGRRSPTMLARILAMTRTFIELVTPSPNAAPLAVDDAVHLMMDTATTEIDRACVKLLVATLGFFPVGTVVELNTGELAIVTGVPSLPAHFIKPPVRLMYDDGGNLLPTPLDLDLKEPPGKGQPSRFVRRTIEYDAQQMKAMRSFVLATVAGKRPAHHPALLRPTTEPASEESESTGKTTSSSGRAVHTNAPKTEPTPLPRGMGAKEPRIAASATRQVSWEEYQKLATPQPRIIEAPPPKPTGPATRQVSWEEYQKLATPQPRIVAAPAPAPSAPSSRPSPAPSPAPAPKPTGPATRQVDWQEYQKLATPQPRIVAGPQPPPSQQTREVPWEEYEDIRSSLPPPPVAQAQPAPAATRQVNWDDFKPVPQAPAPAQPSRASTPPVAASWPEEPAPEQDDTDLLLAGVSQDEDELESFFKSYLDEGPAPPVTRSSPPVSRSAPPAPPPKPAAQAPAPTASPTRFTRWAATEALLSEMEGQPPETENPKPPRPGPPRPDPKRR